MTETITNKQRLDALREIKRREKLDLYKKDFSSFAKEQIKILPKDTSKGFLPFQFNEAQTIINDAIEKQLKETGKVRVIILKARQMGISTLTTARVFWKSYFNSHNKSVVMAHDSATSDALFSMSKNTIDNMSDDFRPKFRKSNAKEIIFEHNDSGYRLYTAGAPEAGRGTTPTIAHLSEVAFWVHDIKILAGLFQGISQADGTEVILESTANGVGNEFHRLWTGAVAGENEYLPIFVPWFLMGEYQRKLPTGFEKTVEEEILSKRFNLSDEQIYWRRLKISESGPDKFKQEYPATPEEAFETANEGYYFAKMISVARQERRICHLPYDENAKTYSAWDIGIGDSCALWIFQLIGKEVHCIDYYENSDEALAHYVKWLKGKPYIFEKHFLPHDAASREKGSGKSFADIARGLGLKVDILPRDTNEMFGIECLRSMLPRFFFDQVKCEKGIKAVESFRKEWNEKLGCYREKSYHDWASHGSKALIYAAEAVQRTGSSAGMTAEEWNRMRKEWL